MMQATKKFATYGLMLGAVLGASALLAPAANAADVNVRVLLPNGQYLSLGDNPGNRWYNRPEYRQYGFSRYHYDSRRRAYVAYDNRGNYYGHNHGWHGPQGGPGGPGGPGGWHGGDDHGDHGDHHDHDGDDHGHWNH